MINWGILGFGRMGLTFANAIEETTNSKLVCVASKSGKKFKEFKNFSYLINFCNFRCVRGNFRSMQIYLFYFF